MPKILSSGALSEEFIQRTVMQWVRMNPSIADFVLHFPNEGRRTMRYGRLLKEMGMRPGVSDLFIAIPNHGYHGAWIELKSEKGRESPHQKKFFEDMSGRGYFTSLCRSVEETINCISWYCGLSQNI